MVTSNVMWTTLNFIVIATAGGSQTSGSNKSSDICVSPAVACCRLLSPAVACRQIKVVNFLEWNIAAHTIWTFWWAANCKMRTHSMGSRNFVVNATNHSKDYIAFCVTSDEFYSLFARAYCIFGTDCCHLSHWIVLLIHRIGGISCMAYNNNSHKLRWKLKCSQFHRLYNFFWWRTVHCILHTISTYPYVKRALVRVAISVCLRQKMHVRTNTLSTQLPYIAIERQLEICEMNRRKIREKHPSNCTRVTSRYLIN